jgi:hypothetical protein
MAPVKKDRADGAFVDAPTCYWTGELPQSLITYGTPIVEMLESGDHAIAGQAPPPGMPRP